MLTLNFRKIQYFLPLFLFVKFISTKTIRIIFRIFQKRYTIRNAGHTLPVIVSFRLCRKLSFMPYYQKRTISQWWTWGDDNGWTAPLLGDFHPAINVTCSGNGRFIFITTIGLIIPIINSYHLLCLIIVVL